MKRDVSAMRILTLSSLYPNTEQPTFGVFVENRLRALIAAHPVSARVVAPVPWFPLAIPGLARYSRFARIPAIEQRHGILIAHPRYGVIPKVGMAVSPYLLAWALKRALGQILASGFDFDLIDAHYFYPDGVAAVMVGGALGKPVTVTARGSDLNQIAEFSRPRKLIVDACRRAAAVITVSAALEKRIEAIGGHPARLVTLRNGVDLDLFTPGDRLRQRARLECHGPTILSVGNLVATKGHDLVVRALAELEGIELRIIGDGPERARLERLAAELRVADRVRFLPRQSQAAMVEHYGAADLLVLASSREGLPNVLLESLACGTPVVASAAGALCEVVRDAGGGVLVPPGDAEALAKAIAGLLEQPELRARLGGRARERVVARFAWPRIARATVDVYREVLAERGHPASTTTSAQSGIQRAPASSA